MLIERFTRAPDMFGYVTSLTYNNPYFVPPQQAAATNRDDAQTSDMEERGDEGSGDDGGSGGKVEPTGKRDKGLLGGVERARALRNVRVVVGDVRGEEPVGRVAFTSGLEVRPLIKNRFYR